MFVVKLGTPSRANYEHFHVYLAYRRQTGTVVTRQTYDRAPRITRPPTAHISRGGNAGILLSWSVVPLLQTYIYEGNGTIAYSQYERSEVF